MTEHDRHDAGFKERTRVEAARERLLDRVAVHDRTERVALEEADGRTVATAVTAERDVPHYRRAAMDGFAVRAEDTFGASDRSPAILREDEAERVHTGSAVPEWADAVVMIEQTDTADGDVEVFSAVGEGENVAPVGEDVEAGDRLYEPGHRLRPSDLGLLKSVGLREVEVYERPDVAVVPTGEELVQDDPEPGEVVETNGLTVSRLVKRWGASPRYEDVVTDDETALADAIEANVDADVVVTTGGSSVGERDLIPEVVDDLGEVFVHGVALRPGHPVALGEVAGTPVVMLPGYPVACIVNAVQFLRPAVKRVGGMPLDDLPSVQARLDGKIRSEPGVRTFARVRLRESDGERVAEPVSASGSGVLSSVALADGWVVVPEQTEGIDAGETVAVENWEAHR
ncbi:molybdopterin molybdotransferase MoeA [Halobacterium sp. KA-4]|jgi:molybdopterin molybdotransferase|uniref:molybdopterin molybdotransferase MoeA n=1 Tax=Halobacterium sp. KA-4 TaxID=2896367 RepID=UPI001E5FA08C|nr:gephyrin-like molybdotransferase Glp [Halobacterium sp. KA-4]MCD2199991.1 molybdopterin molybdotransferase MoeA [Halobacterium sp. KA-4]